MSPKKKKRNGPSSRTLALMRGRGYATAEALADKYGVPRSTIYDWAHNGRIASPDQRAVHVKYLGNFWVLEAAVKAKVQPPAGVSP